MTGSGSGSFAKAAEPFVCGGGAASFASCVIHPIDLAKVRKMIDQGIQIHLVSLCASS
jgi:Mitochondrial carrier protein